MIAIGIYIYRGMVGAIKVISGSLRVTQNEDYRVTEAGDYRIIEQ